MAVSGGLLGLEVGRGLFKPMAVTVSFPGQGPQVSVGDAAPEAPPGPPESEPGGSQLSKLPHAPAQVRRPLLSVIPITSGCLTVFK